MLTSCFVHRAKRTTRVPNRAGHGGYRSTRRTPGSLNLAVSAGVGVYEALRQIDGPPVHQDEPAERRADAPGTW